MSTLLDKQEESATTLNNLGAREMERGEYALAIAYFSSAFHKSKTGLEGYSQGGMEVDSSCATSIERWMTNSGGSEITDEKQLQEEYIYSNPLMIQPSATENVSALTLSVVVSFNLAMAYHLISRERTDLLHSSGVQTRDKFMRQALQLYQYSFRLQRTQAKSIHTPLFFMACINNIGMLFLDMGEVEKGSQCFNHLLALLMYMNTVGTADRSNFASFFRNSWRFHDDVSCAQGAAAA